MKRGIWTLQTELRRRWEMALAAEAGARPGPHRHYCNCRRDDGWTWGARRLTPLRRGGSALEGRWDSGAGRSLSPSSADGASGRGITHAAEKTWLGADGRLLEQMPSSNGKRQNQVSWEEGALLPWPIRHCGYGENFGSWWAIRTPSPAVASGVSAKTIS